MTRWSKQQDDVLWEHGNEGAERCAAIIGNRYGVARTPEAVRRHAYRIGAPIVRFEICVGCGGKASRVDDEGLCRTCHQKRVTELYRQRAERARAGIDSDDGLAAARREYDALRQRVRRERGRAQ